MNEGALERPTLGGIAHRGLQIHIIWTAAAARPVLAMPRRVNTNSKLR